MTPKLPDLARAENLIPELREAGRNPVSSGGTTTLCATLTGTLPTAVGIVLCQVFKQIHEIPLLSKIKLNHK